MELNQTVRNAVSATSPAVSLSQKELRERAVRESYGVYLSPPANRAAASIGSVLL
jgi:hypothetical protein